MLTSRDLQIARDVVEELRAGGSGEKAAAIERIVATAARAVEGDQSSPPRDLLTLEQAARVLSLDVAVIKSWINAGHVQTVKGEGAALIQRDTLLRYLDRLQVDQAVMQPYPSAAVESSTRREFVLAGLPATEIQRARDLTDKVEASQPLTAAEEAELAYLQDHFAQVAWQRLTHWVALQQLEPRAQA